MKSPSYLDDRIARFWDRYLAVLDKGGVAPSAARWYVVRVEEYVKFREGRKLLDHQAGDVVSYLHAVGRDQRLESWQMAQVVHALQLLFCHLVRGGELGVLEDRVSRAEPEPWGQTR